MCYQNREICLMESGYRWLQYPVNILRYYENTLLQKTICQGYKKLSTCNIYIRVKSRTCHKFFVLCNNFSLTSVNIVLLLPMQFAANGNRVVLRTNYKSNKFHKLFIFLNLKNKNKISLGTLGEFQQFCLQKFYSGSMWRIHVYPLPIIYVHSKGLNPYFQMIIWLCSLLTGTLSFHYGRSDGSMFQLLLNIIHDHPQILSLNISRWLLWFATIF